MPRPTPTVDAPVIEKIRHALMDGTWAPGERLAPVALAARFDTSTTVVREALTRLVGENLIEARHNRGFFVPELSLQEFRDLTELRCVTETLALRLSLERGDIAWETELLAAHHQLVRTPRRHPDQRMNEAWRVAHWGFHHALIAACGCEAMLRISAMLSHSTDLYRAWAAAAPGATRRNVEHEHQALLEAALARDVDKASTLLRQHFEETARLVTTMGLAREAGTRRGTPRRTRQPA